MNLEELQRRRQELQREEEAVQKRQNRLYDDAESILANMEMIGNESARVADVAHNAKEILDDLDREFELQTGVKGSGYRVSFCCYCASMWQNFYYESSYKS